MKDILIFGSSGLFGSRFVELFPDSERLTHPTHAELDITQKSKVESFLALNAYSWVINFAAYTDVTAAESQRADDSSPSRQLNTHAVQHLLELLPLSTGFIQISTDMAISGLASDPGPYTETHSAEQNSDLLTWYGSTKAESERLVGDRGVIARVIYPVRASFPPKLDYYRKILAVYDAGKPISLFSDQHMNNTSIDVACLGLIKIIDMDIRSGTFHFASSDITTPFAVANYILEKVRRVKDVVSSSSIAQVSDPRRYPQFGGLISTKTNKILGLDSYTTPELIDQLVSQGLGH